MSTRSNGGIIGPQNRTTSAYANGVWHLFDAQQAVYGRNWPGFVPAAPSAPAIGTVTLGSGTQAQYLTATIPFTAGYNGGNAITKVTAVSIPGGITANTNGSSPITISGLAANTNYTFGVYETNYFGDSPYGYSNPVTTAGVPAAPTIGTASNIAGTLSANIAFTNNSNGGAPITSVTAISTPGNVTANSATSPITVTGLGANTSYTFKVYATNVMGNSDLSSASNSITTPNIVPITYLVAAGGGSAGFSRAGGGGAGGLVSGSASLTPGNVYSVAVGGGGPTATGSGVGTAGTNSSLSGTGISTVTGNGGGVGGDAQFGGGGGGCGGGASSNGGGTLSGGSASQGYKGGDNSSGTSYGGAGGGGMGAAGVNCGGAAGTNGGDGIASSITGSSIYYCGGGGGGSNGATTGSGGLGGGGNGAAALDGAGNPGTANTGGGGGAGRNNTIPTIGGAGGSGVVILSIPTGAYTGITTGSPTVTTSGSNTILKFTGNGSYTA